MNESIRQKIDERYSGLAASSCCLSCGGALNFAKAQEGETCVDIGSGRGTDVLRMAQAVGPTGKVFGIDTADGMLAVARRTAQKTCASNVEFIASSIEKLPLPDGVADLVISNCTINHATDKPAVWREIRRILKPGGRFAVSDIYSSAPVPQEYRNDPAAVAECWAGAVTRNEYLATLELAGFADIRILEESDPYPKGKIEVSSFTVCGVRPGCGCGCRPSDPQENNR